MKTPSANLLPKTLRPVLIDLRREAESAIDASWNRATTRPAIERWLEDHGLAPRDKSESLAGQTAIYVFLKLLLLELVRRTRGTPPLLPQCVLDEISEHMQVDTKALHVAIAETIATTKETNEDFIGPLYSEFVTQRERRKLGQFWTPPHVAEFMTAWAVADRGDVFLDPGHGPGVFTLHALRRFQTLGLSAKQAASQIYGHEISPVAYLMGAANLALRASVCDLKLKLEDFLLLDSVQPAFDAIVCNPPYTRHHLLPARYKTELPGVFHREFRISVSRISSLFLYFFFQSARLLKPTGRMAFITPAEVFESFYSKAIKQLILQRLTPRALVIFHEDHTVFEGVDAAACITLVEGSQARKAPVKLVEVKHWPGTEALLKALEGRPRSYQWGRVEVVPDERLQPNAKWTLKEQEAAILTDPRLVPLKKIASIVRGIATGANDYFVLTDEERDRSGLEGRYLSPVITKTREILNYRLTNDNLERLGGEGKKRWLISLTNPLTAAAIKHIRHGETLGIPDRALVQTRRNWYETERREIPPIIFTYLSRAEPRFILNETDAHALNVFLLVYPVPDIARDKTTLKAFLTLLNSRQTMQALRTVGRSYGGDTLKVEPRELDALPILDPRRVPESARKHLAELFDALCEARSNGMAQEVHQTISTEVARLREALPARPPAKDSSSHPT